MPNDFDDIEHFVDAEDIDSIEYLQGQLNRQAAENVRLKRELEEAKRNNEWYLINENETYKMREKQQTQLIKELNSRIARLNNMLSWDAKKVMVLKRRYALHAQRYRQEAQKYRKINFEQQKEIDYIARFEWINYRFWDDVRQGTVTVDQCLEVINAVVKAARRMSNGRNSIINRSY